VRNAALATPSLLLALLATSGCGHKDPVVAETAPSAEPVASAVSSAEPEAAATASAAPSADVTTQASQQIDPGPSVLTAGKVDGAALRARHVERLKKDTSPVTVLTGKTALELGKRICEAVAPKRPPATPVLLKPNFCGYDSIKDPDKWKGDDGVHGRGTDPEFVRGVIQCLKARGHTKITVAEGCGHSHKMFEDTAHLLGYDKMTEEEHVALVALDDDGVFDVEGDQPGKPLALSGMEKTHVPTLLVPKILAEHLDHGLFLSLPKIKAHRYAVVSLSIKGMQGTVMLSDKAPAYNNKWRMHKELNEWLTKRKETKEDDRPLYVAGLMAFGERIVDVLEVETPDAVLAEGAPAMSGDGFQLLRPSAEKIAIGGTNPVAVDKVGAEFLGLWNNTTLANNLGGHKTSPLIDVARKRLKLDLDAIEIKGDGAELVKAPRPVHFKGMAPFTIDLDPKGSTPPAASPDWSGYPHFAPLDPKDRHVPKPAPQPAEDPTDKPALEKPPAAEPTKTGSGKPEVHAVFAGDADFKADGVADESFWKKATPAVFATDYAGHATPIETKVRFAWSKKGLYAFFDLAYAGFHTDTSKPIDVEREGLYKEDCVEIFLTPDPARPKHYFEIELGPFGHFFDIDVDREKGKSDTKWSSGAKIGTVRDASTHTASIEVALTAADVKGALAAGARLPLGLYRIEGTGERQYLAWSPPRTPKPNFHVPEAFGALVLDP
jgi:uncharacterized protein (DUF362 family)